MFIPTSIYGQPVRSRLEWWIQLDEQFAYAPTLLLPLHISSRDLLNPSMESPSIPTVHDTPLATPPRKSPFRSRPSWAIRKPSTAYRRTPPAGMAETCSWPALNRTNKLGVPPSSVYGSRWSGASLEDDLVQESVGASKPAAFTVFHSSLHRTRIRSYSAEPQELAATVIATTATIAAAVLRLP